MAAVNWKRYGKQKPAWYQDGDDGGCFAAALDSVRRFGGVLEHPAFSHAWDVYDLPRPNGDGWHRIDCWYVCEMWQSAYGHKARKRTWLLYCGDYPPPDLNWSRNPGTHQVGWFDRVKPTVNKKEANATPIPFRDVLLDIARGCR